MCRPVGRLKCSVKATWLRNAKVDMDAMTEVTHNSEYTDPAVEEELQEEQVGKPASIGCRYHRLLLQSL